MPPGDEITSGVNVACSTSVHAAHIAFSLLARVFYAQILEGHVNLIGR